MVKIGKQPPFWRAIRLAFPNASLQDQIFAFYPHIYMAHGVWKDDIMPPDLMEHEKTHLMQQGSFLGAVAWWIQYWFLDDFRYGMELQACIVQLKKAVEVETNTEKIRGFIDKLAANLSSPVYNNCVTKEMVKTDLINSLTLGT